MAVDVDGGCQRELFERGVLVRDGFVAPRQVADLVDCAARRRHRGEFAAARVGGEERVRRAEIRGDHICWFNEPLFAAEQAVLGALERLRLDLNREGYLGLFDLEVHYAWYPQGAGYARHVDQPLGRGHRQVSVILYLNERWIPSAGGVLRLFGGQEGPRDIEPIAGRLVCFLTTGREHCVLPAGADRLSVSGWFRRRE